MSHLIRICFAYDTTTESCFTLPSLNVQQQQQNPFIRCHYMVMIVTVVNGQWDISKESRNTDRKQRVTSMNECVRSA